MARPKPSLGERDGYTTIRVAISDVGVMEGEGRRETDAVVITCMRERDGRGMG